MGADFVRGSENCSGITVNLESNDFFEGLQARKIPTGEQFRKKTQIVELFPEELSVTIRVTAGPCTGPPDPHQMLSGVKTEFSFDTRFIASLRYDDVLPVSNILRSRRI